MPTFRKLSRVDAPPSRVFAWHGLPEALPTLIPPWERVIVLKAPKDLRIGTEVVLLNRIGPFRMRWVALHTEFADSGDNGGRFTDIQTSGPFAKWIHQHIVRPHPDGGTELEDVVTWELPFAPVSHWLAGRLVENRISRMFDFRHMATIKAIAALGAAT